MDKYKHYPKHIIGRMKEDNIDKEFNKHNSLIGNLLYFSNGIIIKTQNQRLQFAQRIITYWYRFGLREVYRGKIKDINKENGKEIRTNIIILEMIGKLRI